MDDSHSQPTFFAQNRRLFPALAALMGAALTLNPGVHSAQAQSPATEGSWAALPYLMPVNPIHGTVLHTGKVLIDSGSENDPQ
jgi:hypothetical protein